MKVNHVRGKNAGKITLFALSTCPWCHKLKQLLNDEGVAYDYVDVDLTQGSERETILKQMKNYNPKLSFPVLLVNDTAIIRFHEEEIREALRVSASISPSGK